jgi:hypothetical protein
MEGKLVFRHFAFAVYLNKVNMGWTRTVRFPAGVGRFTVKKTEISIYTAIILA